MLHIYYLEIPQKLKIKNPVNQFNQITREQYTILSEDNEALEIKRKLRKEENLNWRWGLNDVTGSSLSMKAVLLAYYYRNQKNIAVDITECSEAAIKLLVELGRDDQINVYINASIPVPFLNDRIEFNGKNITMKKAVKEITGYEWGKTMSDIRFKPFDFLLEAQRLEQGENCTGQSGRCCNSSRNFRFEMRVRRQVTFVENTDLDTVTWLEMIESFCNMGRRGEISLECTCPLDRVKIESNGIIGGIDSYKGAEPEIFFVGLVDSMNEDGHRAINKLIRWGHVMILFCRAGNRIVAPNKVQRAMLVTGSLNDESTGITDWNRIE